jgi:hypothetical protein
MVIQRARSATLLQIDDLREAVHRPQTCHVFVTVGCDPAEHGGRGGSIRTGRTDAKGIVGQPKASLARLGVRCSHIQFEYGEPGVH